MTEAEKAIQLEEAYARDCCSHEGASSLCNTLPTGSKGPDWCSNYLRMSPVYGLGHLCLSRLRMPLWQEAVRLAAPSDAFFMTRLGNMTPHSLLPPLSLTPGGGGHVSTLVQTAPRARLRVAAGETCCSLLLVFLLPGIHVVLLDSDCVPEISLLQNGLATSCPSESHSSVTEESAAKASKLSRDRWQYQVIGQGVLLVTEHNAEINAGFIVAFASSHRTAVQKDRWVRISNACHSPQNLDLLQAEANRLATLYWDYVSDFLDTCRPLDEIDAKECAAWVQSGLALAPFAGCVTKYTCDWTIAWSLLGEWTSSEIFLPPIGKWPRNGGLY